MPRMARISERTVEARGLAIKQDTEPSSSLDTMTLSRGGAGSGARIEQLPSVLFVEFLFSSRRAVFCSAVGNSRCFNICTILKLAGCSLWPVDEVLITLRAWLTASETMLAKARGMPAEQGSQTASTAF